MMKRRLITCILCCLGAAGCRNLRPAVAGSGVSKTEQRTVADFDEIEIQGSGRIVVAIGPLSTISITGDDNILPLIQTSVRGRRLVIRELQGTNPRVDIVLKLTAPNIQNVEVSGAASVDLTGMKNESLAVRISGVGDIRLAGQTEDLSFHLNGAGSLKAGELTAKKVSATINGTGSAEVHAVAELKATVSGVGSVTYTGDPKVESHINGLGSVSKKH